MNNYEDLPCSVYLPSTRKPETVPIAEEPQEERESPVKRSEVIPSPPVVSEGASKSGAPAKKSCLTRNAHKDHPPHPALRRKTVAFGRTVNVSQTVEGTSRASKNRKMTSSSGKEKVVEEELKKTMREEMEAMRREMMEENEKRQEELNNRNMDKIQDMMGKLMEKFLIQQSSSVNDKENQMMTPRERQKAAPPPVTNKISIARQIARKEGRISKDAVEILERRIQTDPIFRQQIDDVLADAEYEANRNAYSPLPPQSSANDSRYRAAANSPANALMRETLTVERSIRYDGPVSVERQWMGGRDEATSANRDRDRWRNIDEPVHSTYQFGNSISYYPSEVETTRKGAANNGYYVEHTEDHEDDAIIDAPIDRVGLESKEEKMRRIREKWSRR